MMERSARAGIGMGLALETVIEDCGEVGVVVDVDIVDGRVSVYVAVGVGMRADMDADIDGEV
jgi:hypothetical protein